MWLWREVCLGLLDRAVDAGRRRGGGVLWEGLRCGGVWESDASVMKRFGKVVLSAVVVGLLFMVGIKLLVCCAYHVLEML